MKRETKIFSVESGGKTYKGVRKIKIFSSVAEVDEVPETAIEVKDALSNITEPEDYFTKVKNNYSSILERGLGISEKDFVRNHNLRLLLDKAFDDSEVKGIISTSKDEGKTPELVAELLAYNKPKSLLNIDFSGLDNPDSFNEYVKSFKEKLETKNFSVASINERLRMAAKTPRQRMKSLVMDYSKYAKQFGSKLDPERLNQVKQMFMSDVMSIFNSVSPALIEGGNLTSLLGLGSYGRKVAGSAKILAPLYRKSIQMETATGDVPKNIYQKLDTAFTTFAADLKSFVFEETLSDPSLLDKMEALDENEEL